MSNADRGQVNIGAAEVHDSLFVPALFGRFAEAVAEAAQIEPADQVVDVACGSGALTRVVRNRTTGRVVGIDVNPAMLAMARRHGGAIEYMEGDGQDLPFGAGEFDVAACQFGVMFYPDPARGLAELARVGLCGAVAVWDSIERSEGYAALQELFRDELGLEAARSLDAPFAMGKAGVLEALFGEAKVEDVSFQSIEGTGRFDSIDQWVTTEVRGWTLSDSVSDERLTVLIEVARDRLGRFETAHGCVFGITAKVATWKQNTNNRVPRMRAP
jgi:SAM-dependent methyltransferase